MKIAGFVLLVLGVLGLVYGGIRYTTRETVIDVGPIHATAEKEHAIPIAPIASVALLAAGAAVLIASRRRAFGD
jgi:hypothetical protein